MGSIVTNSWWYTTSGGHCIGIVKTVDEITKEVKFRIGQGDGFNESMDETRIQRHGARFVPDVIK